MTFLGEPDPSPAVEAMYDEDLGGDGFVMNLTRAWAHDPGLSAAFSALVGRSSEVGGLTFRQRGILVSATASARRDSYCSLAWGARLAGETGPEVAAAVLRGTDDGLTDEDRVLATWARKLVRDPGSTTLRDVQALRDAGFTDAQVLGTTVYVGLRLAFSSVNAALGAAPDPQLREAAPDEVAAAVDYGRPVAD